MKPGLAGGRRITDTSFRSVTSKLTAPTFPHAFTVPCPRTARSAPVPGAETSELSERSNHAQAVGMSNISAPEDERTPFQLPFSAHTCLANLLCRGQSKFKFNTVVRPAAIHAFDNLNCLNFIASTGGTRSASPHSFSPSSGDSATATATNVNVNNIMAYRRGEYYRVELNPNNASVAQAPAVPCRCCMSTCALCLMEAGNRSEAADEAHQDHFSFVLLTILS